MIHMIAHWLRLNYGHVVSKLDDFGHVWVGFKCSKCGEISDIKKIKTK